MKSQEVTIIVNDIKSNGIISLENNAISIDMGITNQIIDFRDISIYDKKKNSTLGLILQNNKSIDLIFKDYLLLYKIIDDYKKMQISKNNSKSKKCPECGAMNEIENTECDNCGFPFKKAKKSKIKKEKNNYKKQHVILLTFIIGLAICSTLYMTYYAYTEITKNVNSEVNNPEEKTGNHYCMQDDGTVTLCDDSNNINSTVESDDPLVNELMQNRKDAKYVFYDLDKYLSDYIIIGYKNKNYRCTGVLGPVTGCYEIEYKKAGEKVKISYIYGSDQVQFDCKETSTELVCYMDDGVTEYNRYKKEK